MERNILRNVSIIIFIALMGACISLPSHATPFGETLALFGRVMLVSRNGGNMSYSLFDGDMTISGGSNIAGGGAINEGALGMVVSAPPARLSPLENCYWFFTPSWYFNPQGYYFQYFFSIRGDDFYERVPLYNNFRFSAPGAQYAFLSYLRINGNDDAELVRENHTIISASNFINEEVEFIYVDRDVTITASGKTTLPPLTVLPDYSYNVNLRVTTSSINLELKKGWNAICTRTSVNISGQSLVEMTIEITDVDPGHIRWLLIPQGRHGF